MTITTEQLYYNSHMSEVPIEVEAGETHLIDSFLDDAYNRLTHSLRKLNLLNKAKLANGEKTFVVTAMYEDLRRTDPSGLPFPLNQRGASLVPQFDSLNRSEALRIKWTESDGISHEIFIRQSPRTPRAKSEEGPYYSHEVFTTGKLDERVLSQGFAYHQGRVRTATGAFHALNMKEWDPERGLIKTLMHSFNSCEAQVPRPSIAGRLRRILTR